MTTQHHKKALNTEHKDTDITISTTVSSNLKSTDLQMLLDACVKYSGRRSDPEFHKKILSVLADNLGNPGFDYARQRGFFTLIDHLLLQAERKIKEGHIVPKEIRLARSLLSQRKNIHITINHTVATEELLFSEKMIEEAHSIKIQPDKYHHMIYQAALELYENLSLLPEIIAQKISLYFQNVSTQTDLSHYQVAWSACLNDKQLLEAFKKLDRSWRNFSHLSLQKKLYDLINIDAQQMSSKLSHI